MIRAGLAAALLLALAPGCGTDEHTGGSPASAPSAAPAPPQSPAPSPTPPPASTGADWAPSLDNAQERVLLGHILEYWAGHHIDVVIDDGWVVLPKNGAREAQRYGLTNLSQRCGRAPAAQWAQLVAAHFDKLRAIQAAGADWDAKLKDFAVARKYLRARLYPAGYLGDAAKTCVVRADLPGLDTVLVYDLPTQVRSVHRDELTAWGTSADDAFVAALTNQRAIDVPPSETMAMGKATATLYEADSFFVASEALTLDRLPGALGAQGTLVAVPVRSFLVTVPIQDLAITQALSRLAEIIPAMEAKGPGSVSPHLYWWDGARYHRIAVTRHAGTVRISPPKPFVDMLNGLAAPGGK